MPGRMQDLHKVELSNFAVRWRGEINDYGFEKGSEF